MSFSMSIMQIMDFMANNMVYIVGIMGILLLISYILIIRLCYNLSYMRRRYKKMMTGVDGANLERMVIGCLDNTKAVIDDNAKLRAEQQAIKDLLGVALTKVAVVRFSAFEDMGGDLSYAVAMLDSHNNGLVMSGIFAREDSRSYVKPIIDGTSSYILTGEEEQALKEAMAQ